MVMYYIELVSKRALFDLHGFNPPFGPQQCNCVIILFKFKSQTAINFVHVDLKWKENALKYSNFYLFSYFHYKKIIDQT